MKEQAIQKINKIGKISSILTLIAKILIGMGLAATIIGAVTCFLIPTSLVKVTTTRALVVDVDFSSLGVSIPEDELETTQEQIEQEFVGEEEEYSQVEVLLTQNNVKVTEEMGEYSFTMRDVAGVISMGAIILLMTFITLFFIGALCKAFRDCESPFEENVIKKMQNFAFSLIPWSIISTITESIRDTLLNNKTSIMFSVDFSVILIVLVVLVLAYIFKYGAVLQQESDETL